MTTAEDRPEIDWDQVEWRRASACGDSACVEVALEATWVAVRDSKRPEAAPLIFEPGEWRAFVAGVRQGEFDEK